MTPSHIIEIVTPKKYVLNGLWLGPRKSKRVIVWVHGLSSTMFSKIKFAELLAKDTAVLIFNNRGHDQVYAVPRIVGGKQKRKPAGAAHEVFTECEDDIQGAINFAKRNGAKDIFLAGHSTGCQKSVYWAYKHKGGRGVKGIILLAPMSDWAGEVKVDRGGRLARAAKAARALVGAGKKHELLPPSFWPTSRLTDAQRFLSLYTPDSIEEMFTYAQPAKNPRLLKSVIVPTLVLLAEKDEYADRPAKQIATWFAKHGKTNTMIVPRVPHSFKSAENAVVAHIRRFMREV